MSYKIAMETVKALAMEGAKAQLRKGKPIDVKKMSELIDTMTTTVSSMIEKYPQLEGVYKTMVAKNLSLESQLTMLADNLDKFEKDNDYPYTKGFEAGVASVAIDAANQPAKEEPEKPEPPVDIFKTPAEYMPEPEQKVVLVLRNGRKRKAIFAGGKIFITNPELKKSRIETDITEVVAWR